MKLFTPPAATKDQLGKRWTIFILGMFLMGTGIALSIKGGIGVSPMSSVTNLLYKIFPGISLGTFSSIFILGMFLMGTGIALSIKGGIGVSPMSSVTNLLYKIFPGISLGTFSFLVNFLFFVAEFAVAPKTWHPSKILTQLGPTFICSLFIDMNMALVGGLNPQSYWGQAGHPAGRLHRLWSEPGAHGLR